MAKKSKKHSKKSNLKKILIISGASLLGVGAVTTGVVVPLVLNKKSDSSVPDVKHSMSIIVPEEYSSKNISMIQNTVGFDYDLKLKTNIEPVIENPNIIWTKIEDNTPDKVVAVDEYGKVTLTKPISDVGNYSFTISGTLDGEFTCTNSVSFNLEVKHSAEIPTSGEESWITITNNVLTGPSDKWDISKLSEYTTLTIPSNVTEIANQAFYNPRTQNTPQIINCNIRIVFPKNSALTKIGTGAFNGCTGLVGQILIPNSIQTIGYYSFRGCTNITGLLNPIGKVGESNYWVNKLGGIDCLLTSTTPNWNGDFDENTSVVTQIAFGENLEIPAGISGVKASCFSGCIGIKGTLTLHEGLQTIGNYAFMGCEGLIGNLTIPDTIISIGDTAFGATNLSNLTNPIGKMQNSNYYIEYLGGVKCVLSNTTPDTWDGTFDANTNIVGALAYGENLEIPNTITEIKDNWFRNCYYISGTLTIPNTILSIGTQAFSGCKNLTGTLTLPPNATKYGQNAFSNCVGFNKIEGSYASAPGSIFGYEVFKGMSDTGNNIVENTVSTYSSADLLAFLIQSGKLPSTGWTAAQ